MISRPRFLNLTLFATTHESNDQSTCHGDAIRAWRSPFAYKAGQLATSSGKPQTFRRRIIVLAFQQGCGATMHLPRHPHQQTSSIPLRFAKPSPPQIQPIHRLPLVNASTSEIALADHTFGIGEAWQKRIPHPAADHHGGFASRSFGRRCGSSLSAHLADAFLSWSFFGIAYARRQAFVEQSFVVPYVRQHSIFSTAIHV